MTYIQAISHISIQDPFGEQWLSHPIVHTQAYNETIEPNYAPFIPAAAARRMGKLLKRAVATAADALQKAGYRHPDMPLSENVKLPDAIIIGTGLGCIESTEKFLISMIDNDEETLPPTHFMQSTHNTVSSQIALNLKCHGYNCTYSHRGTSFDSALFDAFVQMKLGEIGSALVGGHDEMTPKYHTLLGESGYWKSGEISEAILRKADSQGAISGSCSLNMLISKDKDEHSLCQIKAMNMLYEPDLATIKQTIEQQLQANNLTLDEIDAVVAGYSGDKDNDLIYNKIISHCLPQKTVLWYKHIFGESFCASAFGVYLAAMAISMQQTPKNVVYSGSEQCNGIRHILVLNHFQNKDHTITLLSKC